MTRPQEPNWSARCNTENNYQLSHEEYSEEHGLIFRDRLDHQGEVVRQLCVPKEFTHHCLNLAHDRFGHRGRNKVYKDLCSHFYWPSMSVDVAEHVKSCHTCQMQSKSKPKPNHMKEREFRTVPSERVAIDIVGPFPKAKGISLHA